MLTLLPYLQQVKDPNTGKFSMDYWETSKKMLSDMGFLDSLRSYDKDNIPPEVRGEQEGGIPGEGGQREGGEPREFRGARSGEQGGR